MNTLQNVTIKIPRGDISFLKKLVKRMGWTAEVESLPKENTEIDVQKRKEKVLALAGILSHLKIDDLEKEKDEYFKEKYL